MSLQLEKRLAASRLRGQRKQMDLLSPAAAASLSAMEGLLIASRATHQIILSTRFQAKAASLIPLALDALRSSSDSAVAWFPCSLVPSHDSRDSDDESSNDSEPKLDGATSEWAGTSRSARQIEGACVCCINRKDVSFALVVSSNGESILFALSSC